MSSRKVREENFHFSSLLEDPENPGSEFKALKPPVLNITQKGEQVGKERSQPRYLISGIVFLHLSHKKTIRAKIHDFSLSGIGVSLDQKLKSYRLGERLKIEFAQPHDLHSVLIDVELKRVDKEENGSSRLGFQILPENKLAEKKIGEFIARLRDPWE